MQKFYADAFFASTPKVLGLDLQPLTLGHAFTLLAIESPYITGSKIPQIDDFLAAVWICSQSWTVARDKLVANTFGDEVVAWGNKQGELKNPTETIKAFSDYLETYLQVAPRYDSHIVNGQEVGVAGKSVRVPWPLAAAWLLMARMSETEAWNTPTVRAFAYIAADNAYDDSLIPDISEPEPEISEATTEQESA